jgi:hypothetical protein
MRGCKFGRGWPKIGDGHYPCVLAKTVFTFDQAQARARDWLVKQVKQESGEVAEDKGPYTVQHGGVAVIV